MPIVSENQRKAMYAAIHGHSTLGIPRKVAEEYISKDEAPEWVGQMLTALDCDDVTYDEDVDKAFGDWMADHYQNGLAEDVDNATTAKHHRSQAAKFQRALNKETHPSEKIRIAGQVKHHTDMAEVYEKRAAKDGMAKDSLLAMDRSPADIRLRGRDGLAFDFKTSRSYTPEGHLHVEQSNISKANVSPYRGKEIPNWQGLGLDPEKVYQLLRDPKELEKGASTFNNKPLLDRHVPVDADEHDPDLVNGSVSNVNYEHPFLKGDLGIWRRDAIDDVESKAKQQLSSAYRYRADMTPGVYQGAPYHGVMRDIVGNHVAQVKDGRAGDDVVVGDEAMHKAGDKVTLNSGNKTILVKRSDKNGQERWECANGGFWYPSDGGKGEDKDLAQDAMARVQFIEKYRGKPSFYLDAAEARKAKAAGRVVYEGKTYSYTDFFKYNEGAEDEDLAQDSNDIRCTYPIKEDGKWWFSCHWWTGSGAKKKKTYGPFKTEAEASSKRQGVVQGNDSDLAQDSKENTTMTKQVLSRTAVAVQGALAVYLHPKLAMDAKPIDLPKILSGITAKNYVKSKPKIVKAIEKACVDILAEDADLEDLGKALDALKPEDIKEGNDLDPSSGLPKVETDDEMDMDDVNADADPMAKVMQFLKGKVSDEDLAQVSAMCAPGASDEDETPEQKAAKEKAAKDAEIEKDKEKDMAKDKDDEKVSKKEMEGAMDAALKKNTKDTEDRVVKRMQGIADAKAKVLPLVGELSMAFDSADGVFIHALKADKIDEDDLDGLNSKALGLLVDQRIALKTQASKGRVRIDQMAMDSKSTSAAGFAKRYPNAAKIEVGA